MFEEVTTSVLPADIQSWGLKPAGTRVLEAALKRGTISTHEIAYLVPRGIGRNPEYLGKVMKLLGQLFKERETRQVPDRDELAHRNQFPIPRVEKRTFLTTGDSGSMPALMRKVKGPTDEELDQTAWHSRDSLMVYYSEVRRFSLLSLEEERELGRRMLENNDLRARNRLIEHNLRLVRWIAGKYGWSKIELEDLIQEGNIGLMTAADKYDYRVGRFTTYATWWIRQAITRMIQDRASMVRLPVHIQEFRQKVMRISEELATQFGRVPTLQEVATQAKISEEKIRRMFLRTRITFVSLDDFQEFGGQDEGDGPTFAESIPDDRIINPELHLEASQELKASRQRVNNILEEIIHGMSLSERDVEIFQTFYGFDGSGKRRTLEVVGQQFTVSRERIRQIISNIWQKVSERGGDMDHDRLLQELTRIDDLEKIVGSISG